MYLYTRLIEAFTVDTDPIKIARRFNFKDQYEMYDYMGKEGYIWNSEIRNYEKGDVPYEKVREKKTAILEENFLLDKYIDLLEELYREREYRVVDKGLEYNLSDTIEQNTRNNINYKNKDIYNKSIYVENQDFQISSEIANRLYKYCKDRNISISFALEEALNNYFQ